MEDSVLYVRMSNQQQLLYTPTLHCYCNYFTIGIRVSGRQTHFIKAWTRITHSGDLYKKKKNILDLSRFLRFPSRSRSCGLPPTTWEVL